MNPKSIARMALLLVLLVVLSGCKGWITTSSLDTPVAAVTERHNAYVETDGTLTPIERDAYLVESDNLVAAVDAAAQTTRKKVHVDVVGVPIEHVSDRHDGYVTGDATLVPVQKRTYLRTTELLRRIVAEARK